MQQFVIIVAGGSGTRMGSDVPKQFLKLAGKPVLMHTIQKFYDFNTSISILVVLPKTQIEYWKQLVKEYNFLIEHSVVIGGETRFHSVKNGLHSISQTEGIVAIHDGVRPMVSLQTIKNCFTATIKFGNATPAIALQDSLRIIDGENSKSVSRSDYKLVQTPQCFSLALIKKAFLQEYTANFTDDASVFEADGGKINLVEGNVENTKITTPFDLKLAENYIKSSK
ncbi:MAG: 2-C-methyl-D-erythritol 4-phosphate cytidylyltransferase [Bacteroidota bacterium]